MPTSVSIVPYPENTDKTNIAPNSDESFINGSHSHYRKMTFKKSIYKNKACMIDPTQHCNIYTHHSMECTLICFGTYYKGQDDEFKILP